ncbi:MAG: hypothetical protein LBH01_08710 [Verrucomicrobiales bacterium]|jgi:hypothetical protein|nr:hypothetical protein [Verrucomicrobiales bacterium]
MSLTLVIISAMTKNGVTLTAGVRQARDWFEKRQIEVFVVSVEGKPALQIPLTFKGDGYMLLAAEFDDDKHRNLHLLVYRLELVQGKSRDGDFFQNLIRLLQRAITIGHLEANEVNNSVDFRVEHMHCGTIPDCIFFAIYNEVLKVLAEIVFVLDANGEEQS